MNESKKMNIADYLVWELIDIFDSGDVSYDNTIIVAKSGAQYNSIKAAYDYVLTQSPSSSNRWVILVYPGVYTEDPITLTSYVDLKPVGERFTTKIIANDINNPLFTTFGFGPTSVQDFSLEGPASSSIFYNNTASIALQVNNCQFADALYALHCDKGLIDITNIGTTPTSAMENMVRVTESGSVSLHFCDIRSSAAFENFIYCESGSLNFGDIYLNSPNVNVGICAVGSSLVSGHNFTMSEGTTALKLDGSTLFDSSTLRLEGNLITHIEILNNSVKCHALSGELDTDKFVFSQGYANDIMTFVDTKEDDEGFKIFGELGVGRPERGSESVFGEGDSYTRGMLVYTYDGSTYVDVSEEARSASESTFTFPNINSGSAIYVASSLPNGDYLKHYGIKTKVNTPVTLGTGDIIIEYWNGSIWAEINGMETDAGDKYLPYAENYFHNSGSYQIRYDSELANDNWTKNNPMSISKSYYWMRFRISSDITTTPILEQFKLHTNRKEINSDGYVEYFGSARPKKTLPWSITDAIAWSSSPGDQDLFVLDSDDGDDYDIGFGRTENSFSANARDRISIGIPIPEDFDTSSPIKLNVYWMGTSDTAGNINWKVSSGVVAIGDGITTAIGDAPNSLRSGFISDGLEAVGTNESDILKRTTITFYVSEGIASYTDGSGDILVISLISDGTDGTDTYPGARNVLNIKATYTAWNEGAHV